MPLRLTICCANRRSTSGTSHDLREPRDGRINFLGRIHVLTIPASVPVAAAVLSQQIGLLSNDALIVALMQAHGITELASHDADFDRVPGITRYRPV
jgi:predicted nucleic acid-binding protein